MHGRLPKSETSIALEFGDIEAMDTTCEDVCLKAIEREKQERMDCLMC